MKKVGSRFFACCLFALYAAAIQAACAQTRTPVVGVLLPSTAELAASRLQSFRDGLARNGFVEGESVKLMIRFAPGAAAQANFAAEMAALPVDVILASATGATLAARQATRDIPIVFAIAGDAIAAGLVESFERPGGNVTGIPDSGPDMAGKRLQHLKEAIPALARVAVLGNAAPVQQAAARRSLEDKARELDLSLLFPAMESARDFPSAFSLAREWDAEAYVTLAQTLTSNEQKRIIEFTTRIGRPLMFHSPEGAEGGALMSLNDDVGQIFVNAAGHVARILRGASPATLPVEPSSSLEFTVNLGAAAALGLSMPQAMLDRARLVR